MQTTIKNLPSDLIFSGHETFLLRQTWLKKVADLANQDHEILKKEFSSPEKIADLGVGKNMLASMKHWALACGIIKEKSSTCFETTTLCRSIFLDSGLDPYSEHPTTVWLLHWQLASKGTRATTIYWLFNKLNSNRFTKEELKSQLENLCNEAGKTVSSSSITKDIDTNIRSYAFKSSENYEEDYADPVFSELGLLNYGDAGVYSFNRGPKTTLNNAAFVYVLLDFWKPRKDFANTLSLDEIAFAESSPGRVFKLDENSIAERIESIHEMTDNKIQWTNSAGIRQLSKSDFDFDDLMKLMLRKAYD